jgi:hypothetical protein
MPFLTSRRLISPSELFLCFRAFCVAQLVRIALWSLPTASLLRYVKRRVDPNRLGRPSRRFSVATVSWAVRAAGRRTFKSTCLVEALTAQLLLARYGHPSSLRVGVARDPKGQFVAHAWVEVEGRIVVGERPGMSYTPLPDLIPRV